MPFLLYILEKRSSHPSGEVGGHQSKSFGGKFDKGEKKKGKLSKKKKKEERKRNIDFKRVK
jgi:hypothetical protein